MRIAVCDDDERELSCIRKLIAEYQAGRAQDVECHYFYSSVDFLCELRGGEYDLVLLDVLMPGVGGMQAAQELRERDRNVRLVFVSASPKFAVESYRVNAYDYLLKPVDSDLFFALLDKIGEELSAQAEQGLVLRSRNGVVRIAFARLAYVEVVNKTVFFYMTDGAVREVTAALADFEGKLVCRPEFLKVHRSYLVNLSHIQSIDVSCIEMKGGHSIPVSRQRRSQVQDAYMRFLHREGTGDSAAAPGSPQRPDGLWRILLVDDDPAGSAVWADILRGHGCIVQMADSGRDALQMAAGAPFDCVLLDVLMPEEDGFSICERIHALTEIPVIFLSCLAESDKQVEGFAAGGIDYITKDTSAELFWTKVETRIRLARSERTQLRYGPLLLDLAGHRVLMEERELTLTPIEFDILWRLSEHPGQVFSPEEIFGMIWRGQPWDGGQMVQMNMSRLRRKLEKAWEKHHFIEAVWGQGYRFVPAGP